MAPVQSIDHNEIFDLAYRFVTETNENIFLTGKAGTGKTTFLKYLKENAAKNCIVAAPTGVAAINAGGVTLHSLFQLPFHPFLPTAANKAELLAKIRFNKQRLQLLRNIELLVIDEISMVRCDIMDAMDTILRNVRAIHHLPFGGVQLLCIGDLFQLPPVAQNQEWKILSEYYSSPFFFDSLVIKEQMPLLIELNKVYRQKDEAFLALLNKVRNNQMNKDDFEDLHLRYNPSFKPAEEEKFITLTSHNNQADLINRQHLQKILSTSLTYEAIIEDEFPENLYPVEASLVLKKGAQVMFLKNDSIQKKYFNGKIGTVSLLEKDRITVNSDGTDIDVFPETWENTRYTLNKDSKLEQQVLGTFKQFPLRLAWAITIHKSQGLTFEKVMIDAGAAFSSGQVYVALSRCTSLAGVVLLSRIPPSAIYTNENIIAGQKSLSPRGSLQERFAAARQLFTQQLLEDIFSFRNANSTALQLDFNIKQQLTKLNIGAAQWIEGIKNRLAAEKEIGLKFIALVDELISKEGLIEKNSLLQKRISDAANHFLPKIETIQHEIKNHPLITEHKETADIINEHLQQFVLAIHTAVYYMAYCKQPFSLTSFLQHKLKYTQPRFNISCYASGKKQQITDSRNPELFETLKRWRDMICEASALPIYMVANHTSLKEIAAYLPLNKKDLQLITGFGKAKAEKYGEDIIEAVQNYCNQHELETNMDEIKRTAKKEQKEKAAKPLNANTKNITLSLFKEGKSVAEIANHRNLAISTIIGHLGYYVASGEIEIDALVNKEKQALIKNAADKLGEVSHKTLFENLPGGITYNDIRIVLASLKAGAK